MVVNIKDKQQREKKNLRQSKVKTEEMVKMKSVDRSQSRGKVQKGMERFKDIWVFKL